MEFIKNKNKNKEIFNEFEEQYFLSLKPTDEELRLFKLIKEGKFSGWNALQSQSFGYQYFLPHGYTYKPKEPQDQSR